MSIYPDKNTEKSESLLATECLKLNIFEEQELAEEGLSYDFQDWPEYTVEVKHDHS